MTETFTWPARINATGNTNFRVKTAQFGDGYSQVAADGINNRVQSWPLSFAGKQAYVLAIKAFLDARGGHEAFYWTPPLGAQGLYRCREYQLHGHGDAIFTLNATFEEVFG